jgi:pimeloyl-ACP methyl ester carboxylesterase
VGPQLALAETGWRVITPHLRGLGDGGDHDPATASMDDYIGDVIDLLDALHIEDAVIGGSRSAVT